MTLYRFFTQGQCKNYFVLYQEYRAMSFDTAFTCHRPGVIVECTAAILFSDTSLENIMLQFILINVR